jgi:hypothetical protein
MPSRSEMLGDGSIRRQKSLGMPRRLQPLHAMLALARRPMRVLTPVIEVATLAMLHPGQDLALCRAVALQLVCNDDAGNIREALEELAEKLLRGVLIAAALHQNIEDIVILIHRAPQVMAFAIDC